MQVDEESEGKNVMSNIKKMFFEFKSIFVTEDLLKENEEHANIVTAATMLNLFLVILIGWALNKLNIANSVNNDLTYTVQNSFIGLLIPAIICFILKGNKKWLKYMLLSMFILVLVTIDNNMSYSTAFLMVIPVILSARYYKKNFTIFVSITNFIAYIIFSFVIGINYIVNYQAIISALLLYYVVVFASVQISQSGRKMIDKQKEITQKGARIETELNLANAIQKNMIPSIFPPFPEHKEIDIYASMTPAKEVGGDFYDMFLIDDNHLAICMADVSGKGIPASLFMMISKILIKNVSCIDKETNIAFTRVNNMLCDGNKTGLFVTAWFGILDLTNGHLEFANAGHNPPLLYSANTGNFEYLRTKPNMVLAGMENVNYRKNEIQIEPGDRIFLYTDGVTEATNIESKLYGEDRLQKFLNDNLDLSVEETIKAVNKDINIFVGSAEQFDDITMLELLYKGKNAKENSTIQRKFKADTKELSNIQEFVEAELGKYNCNNKTKYQINLVIEEIFVNIANYAYKEKDGYCTLAIELEDNKVTFTFEDNGVPFNPLEEPDPDINLSADKRDIGGLGIFLAKKMIDEVKYKYENSKNILIITKNI